MARIPKKSETGKENVGIKSPRLKALAKEKARKARIEEITEKIEKKERSVSPSKKSSTKKESKPSYERMVKKAIKAQSTEDHPFVSERAIAKHVESNYPVGPNSKKFVKLAIRKHIYNGILVQKRASYRLSAKAKKSKTKSRERSTSSSRSRSRSASPAKKRKSFSKSPSKKNSTKKSPSKKTRSSEKEKEATPKRGRSKTPKEVNSPKRASDKNVTPKKPRSTHVSVPSPKTPSTPNNVVKISQSKYDHFWQYFEHGWRNYEMNASDKVEEVYQAYLANKGDTDVRAVKSGHWEYMVDFMAMKQTNLQHPDHTTRDIRRVPNVK